MSKLKDYPLKISAFVERHQAALWVGLAVLMIIFMVASASAEPHKHYQGCGHEQPRPDNNSTNTRTTTTTTRTDSNADATSNSGGNSLSASGGESTSSSSASGGSAQATGGVSDSGGNTQDVYVGGDTNKIAANSAASLFTGYCQTGGSGSIVKGGFSVIQTEQFCQHLRLANTMYQAYERELSHCSCVGVCTQAEASVRMECAESGQAEKFLDAYYENLWDANELVQSTEKTAWIDRVSKQLATPIGLIGALIWLL